MRPGLRGRPVRLVPTAALVLWVRKVPPARRVRPVPRVLLGLPALSVTPVRLVRPVPVVRKASSATATRVLKDSWVVLVRRARPVRLLR